jgi:hypothetical protein
MKNLFLTIILILIAATSAAAQNFFNNSITLSNSAATSLCTESGNGEASQPQNSNYALLTDLESDSRNNARTVKKYVALLEAQPEKFKSQLATINMLKSSQIKVYFNFVDRQIDDKGTEGFTEPLFANNVLITISTSEKSQLNLNGKIAHELEHARQIAAGELAYSGLCDRSEKKIKIRWIPNAYDITDEIKAYAAQVAVAPAVEDCELLSIFRTAKGEADKEKVLSKYFPVISHTAKTNDFIPAGELVMPRYKRIYLAVGTKKQD